jgi:hypothetical protein
MATLPKPTRPAEVPDVPTPVPQRSDRANFAARGDNMLGWFPPGIAGVNANLAWLEAMGDFIDQQAAASVQAVYDAEEQVALAAQQAALATFAAHYKGEWSSLSGDAERPFAVSRSGLFWLLKNDLADITASEPGMTNDWVQVPGVTEVATPVNQTPAAAATDVGASAAITLMANSFGAIYVGDTLQYTQWQIHTSLSFAAPLYDSGEVGAATTHLVPSGTLATGTSHYWRVRYRSSRGTWSAWSRATVFTTAAAFNQYIPTPAATPANIGDAFEGGYYYGMIWNELAQSASSRTLATGTQSFVLSASMYLAPLVYAGQQLEVRSRANPDNRFAGTVVSADGPNLVINVTSINGAGTFADWSVMSRYRLIIAPKSSGEVTSVAWKSTNTAGPAGAFTLTEGWKATLAMVAAGDATTYPAAWWTRSLTIGGYGDWYLPARDELELMARNLKGAAGSSNVQARNNAPTSSYQNQGSWSDASTANGVNRHSVPAGVAYTGSEIPALTTAAAFAQGQAEALAGNSKYWSSSDYNVSSAWSQDWLNGASYHVQGAISKNSASANQRTRAIRRSII